MWMHRDSPIALPRFAVSSAVQLDTMDHQVLAESVIEPGGEVFLIRMGWERSRAVLEKSVNESSFLNSLLLFPAVQEEWRCIVFCSSAHRHVFASVTDTWVCNSNAQTANPRGRCRRQVPRRKQGPKPTRFLPAATTPMPTLTLLSSPRKGSGPFWQTRGHNPSWGTH